MSKPVTSLGFSLYARWQDIRERRRINKILDFAERVTGKELAPWQRDVVERVLRLDKDFRYKGFTGRYDRVDEDE